MGNLRQKLHLIRYQIGRFFFPALEPLFILRENLKTSVRRHFDQAIKNIENKNFAVAQLNLNMVLSLCPNHFLARVYRGRIYLRQKQFRLASEDLMQANRISAYRFTHYRLYREYLESVGEGDSTGKGIAPPFGVSRLKDVPQAPDTSLAGYDNPEGLEAQSIFEETMDLEEEQLLVCQDLDLTRSEREKFVDMGPITSNELNDADWDQALKKLTS